jgi:hypothetical protein
MRNTPSPTQRHFMEAKPNTFPISPHLLFCLLYNLIYFVPLLLVYLLGYSEGGAEEVLGMSTSVMLRITALYATGFTAFAIGTQVRRFLYYALRGRYDTHWSPSWFRLTISEVIIISTVVLLFALSKIAIIPLGVYQQYAFDADLMGGPVWSFSMFCSEMLLSLAVIVLFSKSKHNERWFFVLSAINAVNLLHGTRVFFIITVMIFSLYSYIRGRLPIRRILIYAPPAFLCVLTLTYFIYLFRESASLTGAFSPAKLASPIVYESIFSQFSLITIVNHPSIVSATGNLYHFFSDIILFTIPRILNPDKGSQLFSAQFEYLSPKGGFNGYASSLIYFGLFFPVFYFFLGVIGTWLYEKAKRSCWWLILYSYFTADFLFRIMRDGFDIPMKMIINVTQLIVLLFIFHSIFAFLSPRSRQPLYSSSLIS